MYTVLLQQYQLVLSAREALFNYCREIKSEHLQQALPGFNNESIHSMLIHTANCYFFWLGKTAMQDQRPFFKPEEYTELASLQQLYGQIDQLMNEFLNYFKDALPLPAKFTRPVGNDIYRSPFDIFTHVITHEFHHKGQIVSMSRQLGYTPVDTDAIRE